MGEILKPWYAVATPHADIRAGRLTESIFAANIWAVEQGTAPEIYRDPDAFFRKTFMTTGLSTVLGRVAAALRGEADAGDRIISLQTAFGGGKTHTLLALRHMARHGDALGVSPSAAGLRDALGGRLPESVKAVAVFTNSTCDPTQGRETPAGITTRTVWGELALQLGNGDTGLHEMIRANDEARRVPQGIFEKVLRAASPCLILLDELADYCVAAAAVPVGDTTLADQTISFIQQLTEAVEQVPGAVVVATLPASKHEVAQSEAGQEAFVTLERRFQRLGSDVKPVADDEIYEVVRTRLFESVAPPDDPDYPQTVARVYQEMYADHPGEVPIETTKPPYRDRIARAYPFHPLLIDSFYTRWGSHPDFQRTRGVLKILGAIIGNLWKRRKGNTQTQHLIQPCHIDWSIDAVQASLTRLWGPAYQSVAAADVIGEHSNAGLFDEERGGDYRTEGISAGLASAVMLGSFGGQAGRSGFSARDLKLACARHGLNWGYTDGALLELENRCFYLHGTAAGSLGKRYWFGTKPTLNKLVVQYRHQNAGTDFDPEILEDLGKQARRRASGEVTWRVLVNPDQDLPEQKSLTLLVLPPALAWEERGNGKSAIGRHVLAISNRCGQKERIHRNTLLFLAPTTRGITRLRKAYRERAALLGVRDDYGDRLDPDQLDDLKQRISAAELAAAENLGPAYTVVIRVEGQEIEWCALSDARKDFADHLAYVWRTLVEDEEWILRRVGSVTLKSTGIIPEADGLCLKDAVESFLRFTDKPMIASREAVSEGLSQACADGLLGIARGESLSSLQVRYCKEPIPSLDPSEAGVWVIPPFDPPPPEPKRKPDEDDETRPKDQITRPTRDPVKDGKKPDDSIRKPDDPDTEKTEPRWVRKLDIRGKVSVESWTDLFRCFVNPALNLSLKTLRLGIHFEMEPSDANPLDRNAPQLKSIEESARQLGLKLDIEIDEEGGGED